MRGIDPRTSKREKMDGTMEESSSSEKTDSTIPYARWNNTTVAWSYFDDVSSKPSSSQHGKQVVQDDEEGSSSSK